MKWRQTLVQACLRAKAHVFQQESWEKRKNTTKADKKSTSALNIIQTSGVSDPHGIKCLLPDKHPRDVECRRGSLANLQIKGIPRPSQVSRMIVKITQVGFFFIQKRVLFWSHWFTIINCVVIGILQGYYILYMVYGCYIQSNDDDVHCYMLQQKMPAPNLGRSPSLQRRSSPLNIMTSLCPVMRWSYPQNHVKSPEKKQTTSQMVAVCCSRCFRFWFKAAFPTHANDAVPSRNSFGKERMMGCLIFCILSC